MMTNRDWFCLALRVLGLWQLLQSVNHAGWLLYSFGSMPNAGIGLSMFLGGVLTLGVGFGLLLFAPAIAGRFYPAKPTLLEKVPDMPEANALKIGMQTLGMYALLLGLQSLSVVVTGMAGRATGAVSFQAYLDQQYNRSLVQGGLYFAFAAVLLLGHDRVLGFLSRLRYVAERDAYTPPPIEE